jgi:hypothetical protein
MYFKFRQRAAVVPEGANLYWWKRLVPPVEFGTMHAMLLQLALIPMTMARHTIATLSATSLARFVPFQHTLRMHIHLGYVMVLFVFLSTVLFFVFFGQGCVDQRSGKEPLVKGKESFCDSMKSEIMLTGYGLFAAFGIMGVTSYLRDKMKYELFYAVREETRPTVRRDCFPYDPARAVHAVPEGRFPSSLFTRASLSTTVRRPARHPASFFRLRVLTRGGSIRTRSAADARTPSTRPDPTGARARALRFSFVSRAAGRGAHISDEMR